MKNKIIGLSLIALAALILVTNIFNLNFSIWPLIPIAILTYYAVKEVYKKDYESAVLSGGIAAIIANHTYHLLNISTGKLILVVVLLMFAVSYLVPKKREEALNINKIVQESLDEGREQIKADLTKTKVAEPINEEVKSSEAINLNKDKQTIKTSLKKEEDYFTLEG